MADVKHLVIDLSIAAAAAAAMVWSGSMSMGRSSNSLSRPNRMMVEDVMTMDDSMAVKSSGQRYSKSPLSGKPIRSTQKLS